MSYCAGYIEAALKALGMMTTDKMFVKTER